MTLLALLKHPLLRLGGKEGAHNAAVATLERALLRGPRPRPAATRCACALHFPRQSRRAAPPDPRGLMRRQLAAAAELVARLGAALAPLERLKPGAHPLCRARQLPSRRGCRIGRDAEGEAAAFTGPDGQGSPAHSKICGQVPPPPDGVAKSDYAELFRPPAGEWCGGRKSPTCT